MIASQADTLSLAIISDVNGLLLPHHHGKPLCIVTPILLAAKTHVRHKVDVAVTAQHHTTGTKAQRSIHRMVFSSSHNV